MNLLIAVLIAMGSLFAPSDFNNDFIQKNSDDIQRANQIIDQNNYDLDAYGSVVIDQGIID